MLPPAKEHLLPFLFKYAAILQRKLFENNTLRGKSQNVRPECSIVLQSLDLTDRFSTTVLPAPNFSVEGQGG